jgi:hypothetical protein
MKAILAIATTAAALASAAPALAKEPVRATFCGPSSCRTVTHRATLDMLPAGEATTPLGPAAPYYRVEIVSGEPGRNETHSFFVYYVPSANGMAWLESATVRLHPIFGRPTTQLMRKLVAGLEPFPAPRLSSVVVGQKRVVGAAAQSYLALFAQPRKAPAGEPPATWITLDLRSSTPSPWTDARPDLVYSPDANLLEVGGSWIEVREAIAADVEAGRALDARTSSRRAWLLVPLFGALALLGVVVLRRVP